MIHNGFISINYTDSCVLRFKIKKEISKKYFQLKDDKKIYLDVDEQAKWNQSIDSLFRSNTIRPQLRFGEPLPIIYLVFIIDENGKVLYKGLDRELPPDEDYYQKDFFRLIKLVDCQLEPAILNGKKVASMLKILIIDV